MFRKTASEITAVCLALAVLASAGQTKAVELDDAQLDQITAGAWTTRTGTFDLMDILGNTYIYNGSTFTDSLGTTWAPDGVVYYFYDVGTAFGVLTTGTPPLKWDGGIQTLGGRVCLSCS